VSQTWDEIQRLNENIRRGLQTDGLIGKEDTVVTACVRRDLTPAQKRDKRFYDDDSILVFQRKTGGIGRGETGKLWDITGTHLLVEVGGRIRSVSFSQLEHFHVCRPKELKLAAGDRLQLKGNGETGTGRNLANGDLVTVKSVSSDGRIFEKHYREFVRGYAVTSYASQGKTVAYVLFSDSFPPPWSLARPRSIARSLRSGNDSIAGQSPTKCTDSCDWTLTCFKGR